MNVTFGHAVFISMDNLDMGLSVLFRLFCLLLVSISSLGWVSFCVERDCPFISACAEGSAGWDSSFDRTLPKAIQASFL
ncbi:hypothetical protein DFH09DRAFT_1200480 [Mycena vulgaris]|nr:hypothetical protein DFH09DRAFT_1200480 [Mycena vulgaris]